MSTNEAFAWSELPEIVANYLKPHLVQDYATAMTFLAEDATVIDNGETFENREAALKVFNDSAEQYQVTTTPNSRIAPRYTLFSETSPGMKRNSLKLPPTPFTKRTLAPIAVTKVAMNNQPNSRAVL